MGQRRDPEILIVDQSPYYSRLLTTLLTDARVGTVRVAHDTTAAADLMREHRFSVLLVDQNVRPTSGLAFTRALRLEHDNPNRFVPIIMMTTQATQRLVEAARDYGATEFLAKPISRKTVAERVQHVLKSPRNFIKATDFFGPDRRRRKGSYDGPERRRRTPKKVEYTVDR